MERLIDWLEQETGEGLRMRAQTYRDAIDSIGASLRDTKQSRRSPCTCTIHLTDRRTAAALRREITPKRRPEWPVAMRSPSVQAKRRRDLAPEPRTRCRGSRDP